MGLLHYFIFPVLGLNPGLGTASAAQLSLCRLLSPSLSLNSRIPGLRKWAGVWGRAPPRAKHPHSHPPDLGLTLARAQAGSSGHCPLIYLFLALSDRSKWQELGSPEEA